MYLSSTLYFCTSINVLIVINENFMQDLIYIIILYVLCKSGFNSHDSLLSGNGSSW